ncbi:RHS repeat-associated core domain-containing protein [Nocardiopsis sp. FIRDI 009]|uniref:RHS repeat-associated core domain-containing protein n=1 Tax=Nocardiopsis sp. FIRDI 009 TaxID=714197 RepID=UPI00272B76F2|nr:RHS repeat-associated core domain-containing protein [Nocardiopsis sp. FIRDI 009]
MPPHRDTDAPTDEADQPKATRTRLRKGVLATTAALMSVVVTVTLAVVLPRLPDWMGDDSVPDTQELADPVTGATGEVEPREMGEELADAAGGEPRASWPSQDSATVPIGDTAGRDGMTTVGGLPVQVVAEGAEGTAEVEVVGAEPAARAGAHGLALRVTAPEGAEVHVDPSDFADAFGGSYGNRLALWPMPDCFLTTPAEPECHTPLELSPVTTDSPDTVAATLTPQRGDGPEADEARAPGVPAAPPAEPVTVSTGVFALAASTSSSGGDYGATALQPSSTWTVSTSSGAFTWSYPLESVPVPSSLQPKLSLDYSSQSVDGRTSATNNQGSWIGEGFSYEPGYIERAYKACTDDGHDAKGDQCWATENATLMLNGTSGKLIKDDDTGQWRLESDDNSRIERLTGAENGDDDGEYWRVTTTDGTRYYFGRNRLPGYGSGDETTDSVWTVPVFGDDAGEPCHDSTFADSWCQQGWRWNLDYVEDAHGNVMTYFYAKETNHYALNGETDTNGTAYTRGGYLTRIDYGQRAGEVYDGDAPARVVFDTTERCLPDDDFDCAADKLTEDNARHWPDVPYDLACEEGTDCGWTQTSPSFWTRKRLEQVRTQYRTDDGYQTVDSWELTHLFTDNGDGSRTLWLSEITRTGHDGDEQQALPPVQLDGQQLPNRVDDPDDNIQPLVRFRLSRIFTETGGQIDVNYAGGTCSHDDLPAEGEQTGRCYPVKWNPPGAEDPITDWFHKYVVEEVIESDLTGKAPDQYTRYEYVGDAGWRHTEPDGITEDEYQTWNQWRGYETVRVRTGDGQTMPTRTDHTYLRGLDGGEEPGGGTASVTVTDSTGTEYTDHDELAGHELETITYDGEDVVTKSISEPWRHVTATRTEDWGTDHAAYTATDTERGYTALSDGSWMETERVTAFDTDTGRAERVEDRGDTSTPDDDTCTRTTYADNADAHIYTLIARVESVAVACSRESGPDDLISDVRRHYDGGGYGDAPTRGDITVMEEFDGRDADGDPVYSTVKGFSYDEYGQVTQITDAEGLVTQTTDHTYTHGLVTEVTATNALDHTQVTHIDPARGSVHAEVDANGRRTDIGHDPLGRVTAVWLPNRPKSQGMTPNVKYDYTIAEDAPVSVATHSIRNDGSYATSYEILDGFLRTRQTQAPGPDGGRLVTDTFYNGIGEVAKTNDPYYATGAPAPGLLVVRDGDVQGQTVYTYDGAERPVATIRRVAGEEKWRTTAVHEGDRVHVTPPEGGVPVTVIRDARGQRVEQRQYTGDAPEGDHVSTTYSYTPGGQLSTMTTPAGDEWRYEYDHKGRRVAVHSPDTGTTTSTYDHLDQLVSTTDADGRTVSYVYDDLGRMVESWEGEPEQGTKLTSYQYDTKYKGELFIQTRHTDQGDFRIGLVGQDELYRPTNILYGIPASQGDLAGDYEFSVSYNPDGTVQGTGMPAAGGLPAESLTIGYDDLLRPTTLDGAGSYVTRTDYTQAGLPLQIELNPGTGPKAWITNSYEKGTQRLIGTRVDRQGAAAPLLDTGYHYDASGNVVAITDAPNGGQQETQCFTYDGLLQLTEAWTLPQGDPTGCDAEPTAQSVGGPGAYWHSYTYDAAGNRISEVRHDTTGNGGDVTRDYTYPQGEGPQPNTLREVVERTAQGDTLATFDYDASGNTTVRDIAGERQELDWTAEGRLDTVTNDVGETSYVYTPSGDRLVRSTPYEDVLYLPGMEVRSDKFTGEVKATRYYEHAGRTVALRTPDQVHMLAADHQGTGQVSMNADNEQMVRRYMTPFGEERGGDGWAWPDDKRFLGKTLDTSTGLVLVGAREYDAALGRFLSADPVLDTSDPLQLNGYAYANNSPVTFSDPTGLWLSKAWDKVKSGASRVGSAVRSGYNSAKDWASRNKNTIISVGVGTAVGVGCTALTGGAGVVGCAALGGAVGGLVQYGLDTPRNDWTWSGAATSVVTGAIGGAVGGAAGAALGSAASAGARWAGQRFGGSVASRFSSWFGGAGSRSGAATSGRAPVQPRTPAPVRTTPRTTPTTSAPRTTPATSGARGTCNSFAPGTGVLMADGSTKPIEEVEVGDRVLATDPEAGEQGTRTVAATIVGQGAKTLVEITVDPTTEREAPPEGESAGSDSASEVPGPVAVGEVVIATEGHPFWVPELNAWVEAIDLAPGMWLQTSAGTWVQVSAVEVATQPATVHNLTVADLHTYHVAAGELDLLNHNCNPRTNYMEPGDPFAANHARTKPMEGFHDVVIHGTPNSVSSAPMGRQFGHRELANRLMRDPSYPGGDIRLCACSTGSPDGSFAQNLANKLGVNVMAPVDTLWAGRHGTLFVGPTSAKKSLSPDLWRLFSPGVMP